MKITVCKKESTIHGLKWVPSLGNLDDDDALSDTFVTLPPVEFSSQDQEKLLLHFNTIKDKCKCIVEIGVNRNVYNLTSTSILIDNKNDDTVYIGIDLDDKSYLNNATKNVYTLQQNSHDRQLVYDFMNSINIDKIDFLFIDGWHSINTVVNDWQYTEKLSEFGIVGFHDTNKHPGPLHVFDAIDENMYTKTKYFEGQNDWGVSFSHRK